VKIEGGKLQRNGSFVVEVGPEEGVEPIRAGRGAAGVESSKHVRMVEDRICTGRVAVHECLSQDPHKPGN
jgi:hypothetical protein